MNHTLRNDTFSYNIHETNFKVPHSYPRTKTVSAFIIVLGGIAFIIITVFVVIFTNWVIKERKFRELRHRLIPLYMFDPNDEEDWEADLLNQHNSIFIQNSPDYCSVNNGKAVSSNNQYKYSLI